MFKSKDGFFDSGANPVESIGLQFKDFLFPTEVEILTATSFWLWSSLKLSTGRKIDFPFAFGQFIYSFALLVTVKTPISFASFRICLNFSGNLSVRYIGF